MIYTSDGKGYVRYIQHMGSDLTAANSARASFNKESDTLTEKDERLIGYLAKADPPHTSPFRHVYVTFEIKAPIYVARQHWKHIVGGEYTDTDSFKDTGWNETSGRYIAYDGYWIPEYFRIAPKNRKQGSIDSIHPNNDYWLDKYIAHTEAGIALYDAMVEDNIAPEQARALLGLNMYTHYYWTASYLAIAHFVNLRDHPDAQKEIKEYAIIIDNIMQELFPVSWQYRKSLK